MQPRNTSDRQVSIAPELAASIRAVIWFEPPEVAMARPSRLLCYAMQYTSEPSFSVLRRHFGDDAFRDALKCAPPGIIDRKSWSYWHDYFRPYGDQPTPPQPTRQL